MRAPLVFGLDTSREYAQRVAAHAQLVLSPVEERDFEDGEHRSRVAADVAGRRVAVIHSLHADPRRSVNDKLCRLLFFCAALKDAGAAEVVAIVPYLCYARSDRRLQPGEAVIHRSVARLIESCGVDEVVALDVHNPAAFENAFRCRTRNLATADLFAAHFARSLPAGAELVAVAPDGGGIRRAMEFRRRLEQLAGRPVADAYVEKVRSGATVEGRWLAGDVRGRVAIIVDDMISTGTTLRHAVRACAQAGAARIYAAAAHGLFSGGAPLLFAERALERIVVLDAVPLFGLAAEAAARVSTLDSAARVASALHEAAVT